MPPMSQAKDMPPMSQAKDMRIDLASLLNDHDLQDEFSLTIDFDELPDDGIYKNPQTITGAIKVKALPGSGGNGIHKGVAYTFIQRTGYSLPYADTVLLEDKSGTTRFVSDKMEFHFVLDGTDKESFECKEGETCYYSNRYFLKAVLGLFNGGNICCEREVFLSVTKPLPARNAPMLRVKFENSERLYGAYLIFGHTEFNVCGSLEGWLIYNTNPSERQPIGPLSVLDHHHHLVFELHRLVTQEVDEQINVIHDRIVDSVNVDLDVDEKKQTFSSAHVLFPLHNFRLLPTHRDVLSYYVKVVEAGGSRVLLDKVNVILYGGDELKLLLTSAENK